MNLLSNISLISALFVFLNQCGKDDLPGTAPDCIQEKIKEIKSEDVWNPPAKVYTYQYRGEKVYFIPQHCCDIPSLLLDSRCNVVCQPDGGFTGRGDGRCNDFFDTRTNEELLWADTRQ